MSNKRISAEIVALTPNIPGQAVIQIRNWDLAGGLKFKIEANGGRGYLNETSGRSEWGSSEYWFHPQAVEQDAEWVRVHIGQTILDPLLEAGARYKISLCAHDANQESTCTLNIADDVYPSSAAGSNSAVVSGGALATPEPVAVSTAAPAPTPELQVTPAPEPQAQAEPVATPELELELEEVVEPSSERAQTAQPTPTPTPTASPASKKGKGKVILLALLGLVIVALLAALGWWLAQQKLPSLVSGGATAADAANADGLSANGGCALASMGTVDELQFVQSCLQETQDSTALLAVIQHAKANNHCGVAQRLYANRAQSGDSVIALAYAKEYDPQFYADNTCFKAADTETALYWYETVLLNEPNNAEAAQRVEELNQ